MFLRPPPLLRPLSRTCHAAPRGCPRGPPRPPPPPPGCTSVDYLLTPPPPLLVHIVVEWPLSKTSKRNEICKVLATLRWSYGMWKLVNPPSDIRFVKNDATHGFNRNFLVKMLHTIKVALQGYFWRWDDINLLAYYCFLDFSFVSKRAGAVKSHKTTKVTFLNAYSNFIFEF